jgi:hypothetical protein
MKNRVLNFLLAPLALALAIDASAAKAVLDYNIYESISDLVVETSGSLKLPLTSSPVDTCNSGAVVAPAFR